MKNLEKLKQWLDSLGPSWNLFGDIDRAKYYLDQAIKDYERERNTRS